MVKNAQTAKSARIDSKRLLEAIQHRSPDRTVFY